MSGTSGMRLRVKTEELEVIASEVESQINTMRTRFNEVGSIINRSSSYWEGEGRNSYMKAYCLKCDSVEEALRRFSDNVTNLRKIAGIYNMAEASITESVSTLASDVIV